MHAPNRFSSALAMPAFVFGVLFDQINVLSVDVCTNSHVLSLCECLWFFSCRFSDIILEDNSGIPTQAFLDSCYAIVPVLGRTLYLSLSIFHPFFALSFSFCQFCRLSQSLRSLVLCLLKVVNGSWELCACVGLPCALDYIFFLLFCISY